MKNKLLLTNGILGVLLLIAGVTSVYGQKKLNGNATKKVTALRPKCPVGFIKK